MKKTLAQRDSQPGDRECVTLQEELEWLNWSPQVAEEDETQPEDLAETDPEVAASIAVPIEKPTEVPKLQPISSEAPLTDRPQAIVDIEDAPVTAQDVLITIVAAGLKVGRPTLDPSQSIKVLSKGMFPSNQFAFMSMYGKALTRDLRSISCPERDRRQPRQRVWHSSRWYRRHSYPRGRPGVATNFLRTAGPIFDSMAWEETVGEARSIHIALQITLAPSEPIWAKRWPTEFLSA